MTKDNNNLTVHRPKRRPGLRDLAEKLGVSHTAVARALRNDPRLTESLRQRVHAVARQEGYLSSDVTKSLITGWSGTIGVIVPQLTSPFVIRLLDGITHQLWDDGTVPMVLCSDLNLDQEEQMLQMLARKRVSGVIIMPCLEDRGQEHFAQLLQAHTPIISLDSALPRLEAPLVGTDNEHGAVIATQHLIEQGHRHILHLSKAIDNPMADRRRETGYRRAMEEAGLKPQVINLPERRITPQAVADALETFFDTRTARKTTAIFAFNDHAAYCTYLYAARHNLQIGEDLALVGYGNGCGLEISAALASHNIAPSLSSVEQHPDQIGRTAAKLLRQIIDGKPFRPTTLIKPELVVRSSSSANTPSHVT